MTELRKFSRDSHAVGATELAKLASVSRATIYRYKELQLLELTSDRRFTSRNVTIVRLIERLKDVPFRFHLQTINAIQNRLLA